MYFDSKKTRKHGPPWTDSRSNWEKSRDEYFEELENLVVEIDVLEDNTSFISELTPEDFTSGFQYVFARLKDFRDFLKEDFSDSDKEDLMKDLYEIYEDLIDLYSDALLYDDVDDEEDEEPDDEDWDDEWEDEDDCYDEENCQNDDF